MMTVIGTHIYEKSQTMFRDPAQRRSTKDPYVRLYSKLRIDRFARLITAVLAVALLMAPVVVLFMHDESGAVKIAVILVFTLFFAAALSIFTKAKRHEVFAATAAYVILISLLISLAVDNGMWLSPGLRMDGFSPWAWNQRYQRHDRIQSSTRGLSDASY